MMGVGLTDDAGRAAYLAGLHAAQAFTFETMGRVFKRHSGVQREFSRLVKADPRVDTGLRTFLSPTYQLKGIADYLTGPGSHVSAETAREAIRRREEGERVRDIARRYNVSHSTISRLPLPGAPHG